MQRHAVELIVALTFALGLMTPLAAHAQPPARVPRIGVLLFAGSDSPAIDALRQGLREHGWVEGGFAQKAPLAQKRGILHKKSAHNTIWQDCL